MQTVLTHSTLALRKPLTKPAQGFAQGLSEKFAAVWSFLLPPESPYLRNVGNEYVIN
jgi:hypothetical protein